MATVSTPAAVADALAQAAARYGTPAYVYDLSRIRARIHHLTQALPGVEVRYSVKANPAPAVCRVIADAGLGAEVSSAGELTTALDAGFLPSRIMVSGPYKEPALLDRLAMLPEVLISVDSVSELTQLATAGGPLRQIVARLRPDYPLAGEMCVGPASRFGIPIDELDVAAAHVHDPALRWVGFHVYGGSQILDPVEAAAHLDRAHDLSLRAAKLLTISAQMVNLGGGFGVPYTGSDTELDLAPVAATLRTLSTRTPDARLVLELGRYLVADAGWYLTRVVHQQSFHDGPAVVVDGGVHHRPDLCGLDLAHCGAPPLLLGPPRAGTAPTAVLGCLCLPWDVLAHAAPLPALHVGDVLAFPNAGAYGLTAAPTGFIGHRLPAEVSINDGILTGLAPALPAEANEPVGVS